MARLKDRSAVGEPLPTMMPPTKASMYCRSSGVKNGFTNKRAKRAPTGSDNPCTVHSLMTYLADDIDGIWPLLSLGILAATQGHFALNIYKYCQGQDSALHHNGDNLSAQAGFEVTTELI